MPLKSNVRPSMNADPHWTAYLSALLAPVVAVLGSVIAYRQWLAVQPDILLAGQGRREWACFFVG